MKRRLAIIDSHPIQYHAHWYRELTSRPELDIEVLYCHRSSPEDQAQAGFGVGFEWDIPLLVGYRHRFLPNVSMAPGVTDFDGTDTPEIRGLILRERFDAVMVSGWHTKSYWQAIRACWQSGTPVMVRSDSHLHDDRSLLKTAAKWPLYRHFIPRLDACLPVGTWSCDYFLHYGAKPERTFVVPHCVAEAASVESRRNPEVTTFLFAGKFIARKRPLEFIRAISSAGPAVHGLLAGDGPMRSEMEALASQLHAPVTFTGFLNQTAMPDAYAASDVLVLPSDQDTWGLVVNEAMVRGIPCIVSDRVGCGPDLIVPGETGFVFPTGDVPALAARMREIAGAPGMAARMGTAAKLLIAAHSPHASADSLCRAIAAIMGDE